MKRWFAGLGMLVIFLLAASAQEKKYGLYAVGFYNLENLFDTIHDEGKNDYEYLPQGAVKWNGMKYFAKLKNMSTVLAEIGTDRLPNVGASVIGVSEVENSRVMTDLVNQPALKERGMRFVHIEGPDRRGVDCALIYNPRFFTPEKSFLQPYIYEEKDSAQRTRGFLTVQGKLAGDDVPLAQPRGGLLLSRTCRRAGACLEGQHPQGQSRHEDNGNGRYERRPVQSQYGQVARCQKRDERSGGRRLV